MVHMPRLLEVNQALVKQIRESDIVDKLISNGNGYFDWLQRISGVTGPLASLLMRTEFVSDGIDDIIAKKAKEEIRRKYVDDIAEQEDLFDDKTDETLLKSIRGNCCLFEVIVCLACSINEMFEDLDAYDGCAHFCDILLKNCWLIDENQENWEECVSRVIERRYDADGNMGLFPLKHGLKGNGEGPYSDRRKVSLWQQMNDWVDQHTNEDGEWVD